MDFDLKTWAAKIDRTPEQVPACVRQILECAANAAKKVCPLTHKVAPPEVEAWLVAFAKGAQYSHETYGHAPENFGIFSCVGDGESENDNAVLYAADGDYVVITSKFIALEAKSGRSLGAVFGSCHTGGRNDFTHLEMATLLGVEEAYHAYQFKVLRDRYSQEDRNGGALIVRPDVTEAEQDAHYATNPMERDATIAVKKAIKDLGFGKQPKTAPPSSFANYDIC